MDDSARTTFTIVRTFPKEDKTYILPDYRCNRYVQAPNIYHIKSGICNDLKDEDFVKAAEEYKQKHKISEKTQQNQENTKNYLP